LSEKIKFLYFSLFISPLKVNDERIQGCAFLLSPSYRYTYILCFVDCATLYNLANKANSVHNLFLVYLSISTCFGQLCAHNQEKKLCLCDTWYLLFCVDDCRVFIPPCIPDSHPHRITSNTCHINTVVSSDDGHIVARDMQRLINILRINFAPSWVYLQEYTYFSAFGANLRMAA